MFDLALQELGLEHQVLWIQCQQSLVNNPFIDCCFVVDVSTRWTFLPYDLNMLMQYASEMTAPVLVYTTDVQKAAASFSDVAVKAYIPKCGHFDLLVEQLKPFFQAA